MGIATAALAGTIARLTSGWMLDRGANCALPIRGAALIAIIADFQLLTTDNYNQYIICQLLIGFATGLYWPAIELGIPPSCGRLSSRKGFALARSADALGTSLGVLIGSILASKGIIRSVYTIDIICMLILIFLLSKRGLSSSKEVENKSAKLSVIHGRVQSAEKGFRWLKALIPLFIISLLATGILSLLQSALPLDLVKGGLHRPPIIEAWSSLIIAIQLCLLLLFQWPIGNWLAKRNVKYGLRISLFGFGLGSLLIGLSAMFSSGAFIAIIAQVPLAFALAAFLPTATEAVIKETPIGKKGIAMAIFSQCFAVSAFIAPLIAGKVIDAQGHAMLLWLIMSASSFSMIPILNRINLKEQR